MAFTSGMERSIGDAVILMDGDLQDPPEMIPALVREWLAGYDVVYGVREHRREGRLMEAARKAFYRIYRRLSYLEMPLDAGDFSILSRRVVQALLLMPERDRFLRGLRAWVGFRQTGVPYTRAERFAGQSTNSLLDNVRWAKRGIFSFSYQPLEMISFLVIPGHPGDRRGRLYFTLCSTSSSPNAPRGFMTLLVAILFLGSLQFFCLSILAEYMGRIFEEVKQRPAFIVRNIINDPREASGTAATTGASAGVIGSDAQPPR